ncbi:MAG: CcmD family protein [Candidatus Thermoplasmatota archaeon]|jgi:CcmD family protein|nr:CcmD family protein [Candidatus Thermoplasmatota archaeon]MDP7265271.1 CcmD family protein [Candidatus Thermoplasmatota archaeon]
MDNLVYLYIAYTIIWAALFIYILKLHVDQKNLKKDLELLMEVMNGGRKKEEEKTL